MRCLIGTPKNPSTAIKSDVINGTRRLVKTGGAVDGVTQGHVIVDGRAWGLTEEDAQRGWGRVIGEANKHGLELPAKTTLVLADGSILVARPRKLPTAAAGSSGPPLSHQDGSSALT